MAGGRHSTTLTPAQQRRLIEAIRSGISIKNLHESGRFQGVSRETLAAIADEHGVSGRMRARRREAEELS